MSGLGDRKRKKKEEGPGSGGLMPDELERVAYGVQLRRKRDLLGKASERDLASFRVSVGGAVEEREVERPRRDKREFEDAARSLGRYPFP